MNENKFQFPNYYLIDELLSEEYRLIRYTIHRWVDLHILIEIEKKLKITKISLI
ncbi:MAG: hypothetical protein ACMUEM_03120 [Flavobacteriales bacterium AspAUS03]